MDQNSTGTFIMTLRKEQGLTQRQLADQIGVSDKAISRWETGRGMPDTGVMLKLCEVLQININELLSGERLSEEAYSRKAEDNMVELMKNNEAEKKESRSSILGIIIGMVMLLLFVLVCVGASERSRILWFLDAPSILAVVGPQFIVLGAAGQFRAFIRGFQLVFALRTIPCKERAALAEKSEYAVQIGIGAAIISGVLSSIIGIVMFLGMFLDISKIGPNLAVALLTIFYAMLIALVLYIVKGRLHKLQV
ncbi:MAG: helix-turn-helix domain-containing protein [Lachnospiraceae bacterium]|nr:helix-turn-helix domain-containing protein [Lachnospiraceae bacterium]